MRMLYVILLTFLFLSCRDIKNKQEDTTKTASDSTEEVEKPSPTTPRPTKQITFCCSNHEVSHCGSEDEIKSLSENGCKGFTAK